MNSNKQYIFPHYQFVPAVKPELSLKNFYHTFTPQNEHVNTVQGVATILIKKKNIKYLYSHVFVHVFLSTTELNGNW